MSATQSDPSTGNITDSVSEMAGDAQAKAQDVAGKVQDQAQQAVSQGQDRLREQVESRSAQFGEQLTAQAADLRSVSGALRDQGNESPAQAADRLAGYVEQAGTYLKDKGVDAMLEDAENFGRERPAVVALGAMAAGFAGARFLKASSGRRYAARQQSGPEHSTPGLASDAGTAAIPDADIVVTPGGGYGSGIPDSEIVDKTATGFGSDLSA